MQKFFFDKSRRKAGKFRKEWQPRIAEREDAIGSSQQPARAAQRLSLTTRRGHNGNRNSIPACKHEPLGYCGDNVNCVGRTSGLPDSRACSQPFAIETKAYRELVGG